MKEKVKIFINSKDYFINMEISNNILLFELVNSEISSDCYKNNYTYFKLVNKVNALSYFTNDISDIFNELFELIKKNEFVVNFFELFSSITFYFNKFTNKEKNAKLELYLYKTDSRQATLMLNQLEEKINKIKSDNIQLMSNKELVSNEIQSIMKENDFIKNKLKIIDDELLIAIQTKIGYLENFTKDKCNKIQDVLNNLKDTLKSSLIKVRRSTVYNPNQLPVLRNEEDKNLLIKFFNLDYETDKLYDSNEGDSIELIKLATMNKKQILIVFEAENGRRFGSYSTVPWFSSTNIETYLIDDPFAFIFSFDKKRKFKITNQKYVISFSNDSINFGLGPDIFISDNFCSNNKNYSHILGSYGEGEQLEEGYSRNNYLVGLDYFKISRAEVYQVFFK